MDKLRYINIGHTEGKVEAALKEVMLKRLRAKKGATINVKGEAVLNRKILDRKQIRETRRASRKNK